MLLFTSYCNFNQCLTTVDIVESFEKKQGSFIYRAHFIHKGNSIWFTTNQNSQGTSQTKQHNAAP